MQHIKRRRLRTRRLWRHLSVSRIQIQILWNIQHPMRHRAQSHSSLSRSSLHISLQHHNRTIVRILQLLKHLNCEMKPSENEETDQQPMRHNNSIHIIRKGRNLPFSKKRFDKARRTI